MGLCGSSKSIYTKYTHLSQWKHDFDALMVVDSDLEILYKLFQNIDKDGSGEIDLVELIHYLRLQRTKFNKRVFTIFDEDGSGTVDKDEMVNFLKKVLGKKTFQKLGDTKNEVNYRKKHQVDNSDIQLESDDSDFGGGMAKLLGAEMIASVRSLQAMGNEEAARREQELAR